MSDPSSIATVLVLTLVIMIGLLLTALGRLAALFAGLASVALRGLFGVVGTIVVSIAVIVFLGSVVARAGASEPSPPGGRQPVTAGVSDNSGQVNVLRPVDPDMPSHTVG